MKWLLDNVCPAKFLHFNIVVNKNINLPKEYLNSRAERLSALDIRCNFDNYLLINVFVILKPQLQYTFCVCVCFNIFTTAVNKNWWVNWNSAKQKQTTWHWTENKISAFYSILNVFIYTQKTKYIWNGQTSSQQTVGIYASLNAQQTAEPRSIWNKRNQTVDLPSCTAYTVHLHHTFTLTLKWSRTGPWGFLNQSASVPNDLDRGQSG